MTSPSIDDRVLGGIYGALIGDALGVPVEFSERTQRDFDPVTGMRAFGMWNQPAGTWSDDGALMLYSAEGLMDGYDLQRVAVLFVRWMTEGHWAAHRKVFDIGATTRTALLELQAGCAPEHAGGISLDSNGNGSLMRILPVALRFHAEPIDVVIHHAMQLSRLTHGHVRSQLACAFYCVVAVHLLHGSTPEEAYRDAITGMRSCVEMQPLEIRVFARLMSGALSTVERREIGSEGYVIDTLEASLWCLLRGETFEQRVLAAVNLGGDTDTTGCVAGGLAGLVAGRSRLPAAWLEVLPRRDDLESLLGAFVQRCT